MIRFTCKPGEVHLKDLHREFLRAGARPRPYWFYSARNCWALTMPDVEEGVLVRQVSDRLGVDYDEVVVVARLEPVEAG